MATPTVDSYQDHDDARANGPVLGVRALRGTGARWTAPVVPMPVPTSLVPAASGAVHCRHRIR
jgi:hypothetical protein